jgi:rhodanese-related sulfurtransferase
MKQVSLSVILALMVLVAASASLNAGGEVPRISKEEVKAKLGSPNVIILDVRTAKDWDNSGEKIVGALRVDPGKIDAWSGALDRGKEIILYCT